MPNPNTMDPITRSTSDSNLDSTSASIQNLSSILNNPSSSYSYYSSFWPSSEAPPPPPPSLPDVPRSSFSPYLSSISETYSKFEHIIKHSVKDSEERSIVPARQGQALVECLREVPSLFFKEDFDLADGPTFKSASSFSIADAGDNEGSDKLTQYLDCVEMHLVREIELRSESFYEAQGGLVGLNGEIVKACDGIRRLKEGIRALEGDLVGCAKVVQELSGARNNLVALQQKLTVILYVSQAVSALKLLVAGADCAGALDVIDDLQHLIDTDELAGLHCFRHLRDQLSTSLDSINSILSAEFVRASMHDARAVDSAIVLKIKTSAPFLMNGLEEEKLNDDESSFLRDCLLPLIVGLLRTAKLPAVLRIYRETLITEMKAAIKSTVAELLPILLARPLESDSLVTEKTLDSEGSNISLATKLRSLSSESFVQLLFAIFKVVQAHLMRAAEVKRVIEWVMGNIDGGYPTDSLGQGSGDAEESDNQNLPHATYSFPRNTQKISLFQGRTNEAPSPITSKNFLADVLRENTEAVFAACDTAHGRWTKLLGVRALLHPKLRLQEFLSIYNITQDFITITEKIGGRLGYSIRGTLQSQSKAFVDFQHESRMAKIKAVLDQETWVSVDVPDEFQAILSSFASYESSLNESAGHAEDNSSTSSDDRNTNGQARITSQTLVFRGVGYHMVNCGLILLKMLAEYVDISKCLPTLASEVVHRVSEILKLFNNRTCQLILGAGAMQVSGLKSITSKHLALASQVISFVYTIIPEIRNVLFLKIPEARKAILLSEIERVAQDYKIHRDEIHTKLVQIMRERLLANIRKLPQIVETWNGPDDDDPKPSLFAKHVTKQATYLHQILSQILLEADVLEIFRQVVQIFHSHISEAFSKLDLNTPQAKRRLKRDIEHILGCLRMLPSDDSSRDSILNYGLLDELLVEKFGPEDSHS